MTEIPRNSLEKHPLWALYKSIASEQWWNHDRLSASDFKDKNEADFQAFLQDEAINRLAIAIGQDFSLAIPPEVIPKKTIYNPEIREKYENGWKNLILEARLNPISKTEILQKVDSLYQIWKTARKQTVINVFSVN